VDADRAGPAVSVSGRRGGTARGGGPALGRQGRAGPAAVCCSCFLFFSFSFTFPNLSPNQFKQQTTLNSNQDLNPTLKNNAPACMQQ
jgi:hypothetical protein